MDASLLDTQWIWHPDWIDDGNNSAGGIVHFRRQLKLENLGAQPLKIQISADTKYQLFVNSRMIHTGPVKGDEHMWFYDEIDIQPYLNSGVNNIGVRVLRLFYATPYATSFPRLSIPGLFIRVPEPQSIISRLRTDESWGSALDLATIFRTDQQEDDFLHIYEDVSPACGSRLLWKPAKCLNLPTSHGLTPPWRLTPRMIPSSSSAASPFKALHNIQSSLSRDDWKSVLLPGHNTAKSLRLPARTSHHIEIEAENHLTAILSFRFQRPDHPGSVMRIKYSECYENPPISVPYLRSKDNRTDDTKQLYGPEDRYTFSGAAGIEDARDLAYTTDATQCETFSPFHFRTLRYLSIDLTITENSDLVFNGIEMRKTNYPLEVVGSIELPSSSGGRDKYEEIWSNSVRTLENCMHDCYEDCPFYEQLQYAMDARSSCLFTYAVSGDDRMARQTIMQLHNSYRPEIGLVASRSPAHQLQVIPHFSLFWICTVTDHFHHFGDAQFIRQFLSTCDGVVESFARRIDAKTGLIVCPSGNISATWDFVDWTTEWRPMGIPPAATRTGVQTFTNLLYAYALKNLAQVVEHVGRVGIAHEYLSRAKATIDALREHCWDGSQFTDGLARTANYEQDLSQHNQVWAVLCDAVTGDEAATLLRRSLSFAQDGDYSPGSDKASGKFTKASTAMSTYVLRAMSKVEGTLYEDLFHGFWQPWRKQLAQNLTTWCEDDVTVRSDCHAWASAPLYEFMAEVAGVKPAEPGWKIIAFRPRINLFPQFKAKVPLGGSLRSGVAEVAWTEEKGAESVCVTLRLDKVAAGAVIVRVLFPDGHIEEHPGPVISLQFKSTSK